MSKKYLISACLAGLMLSGCADYPTEIANTVDGRAMISIQSSMSEADVYLDGVMVGKVKDFEAKKNALRVLPGTHVVRVGEVQERFFVSNGTYKIIVVK